MIKLKFLFLPTILALAFGLMLSCAKKDDSSSDSSTDSSSGDTVTSGTSTSRAITVSGKVQKGPYVQGTEITVRELDSSMIPTGNTFTGTIDDNTGSFGIKGTLTNKIVELSADGYYFNEVSGSLSTGKLTLSALSDLTDSSSVNVNLMTHLEKKRVEYLMDNSKMTFAAAKTQAQTEIMKIFNIENVTLGNSETLDISKSGDGNAVLLAISAILQSDKTEAELTELLSTINTDIRTDGTMDSTITKAALVTATEYLKSRQSTIRSNIETRYNTLGISVSIPSFETYILKLDTVIPTVSSVSPTNNANTVAVNSPVTATFSETMTSSSITTSNFYLKDSSSNTISSSVSYSGLTATLTPSSNLSENSTISATLTTNVVDLAGNGIASNYSWSFTTGDFTAPIVAEVTAVTTPTNDNTPSYIFSSTEPGTITYGGSCSSSETAATTGDNTIDFSSLSDGTYDNCTIKVTDNSSNVGNTLSVTSFTVDTDTTAPTVSSSSPADSGSAGRKPAVSVTFSEGMDNSTITTNTSDTDCDGSIQVSSNNFSSCIQMSSSPTVSNSSKTFTISPSSNLSSSNTYKIRVTTSVKDDSSVGNNLSSQWTTSSGFTVGWSIQGGTSSEDRAYGIAIDNSTGNIYITGHTKGNLEGNTLSGTKDLFVTKYNSGGIRQWTTTLGTSSEETAGADVSIDSSENVFLTGYATGALDSNTNTGAKDVLVAKYNSSGTKQWTRLFGLQYDDYGTRIKLDSSGNAYISTLFGYYVSGVGQFRKYNSSGTEIWDVAGSSTARMMYDLAIDNSNNIYLVNNTFYRKFDSSGNQVWTSYNNEYVGDSMRGVAVDNAGYVYIAAYASGIQDGTANSGGYDIFLLKYSTSDNTKQWTRYYGSSSDEFVYDVELDSSNNVYVIGETAGNLDGTNSGGKDVFLVKYNSSGTRQWTKQLGSSSNDIAQGIAIDNSNNIYVVGYTAGELDGSANSGNDDYFILKYDSNGNKQ